MCVCECVCVFAKFGKSSILGREADFVDAKSNPKTVTQLTATMISEGGLPSGEKLNFKIKNRNDVPSQFTIMVRSMYVAVGDITCTLLFGSSPNPIVLWSHGFFPVLALYEFSVTATGYRMGVGDAVNFSFYSVFLPFNIIYLHRRVQVFVDSVSS